MWYVLLGGRVPTPLVHHRTFSQAKKACRSALILTPPVQVFRWGAASPNTPRTAGWWPAWSLRIEKLRDVGGRDRGFEMNLAASLSPGGIAEQSFLLDNVATGVLCGPDQLPEYHAMLTESSKLLGK